MYKLEIGPNDVLVISSMNRPINREEGQMMMEMVLGVLKNAGIEMPGDRVLVLGDGESLGTISAAPPAETPEPPDAKTPFSEPVVTVRTSALDELTRIALEAASAGTRGIFSRELFAKLEAVAMKLHRPLPSKRS